MNELVLLKIIFGILLLIGGTVLLFLAFKLFYKYLIQEKRCTAKTKGIVKKYAISGTETGVHLPIVYYSVNNQEYKVKGPEFKAYIDKKITTPFTENNTSYKITDDQKLIVNQKINSFVGVYKNPLQELYPIDSEIDVYYDPNNPKLSYVLRYCNRKYTFWLTFLSGIGALLFDFLMLILL